MASSVVVFALRDVRARWRRHLAAAGWLVDDAYVVLSGLSRREWYRSMLDEKKQNEQQKEQQQQKMKKTQKEK